MPTETGRGELFFHDGRSFGAVDYEIEIELPTPPSVMRRMTGQLWLVDQRERAWGPFFEIANNDPRAALRLEDGRWWLCNVQADGSATNAGQGPSGGFYPLGPQPQRS